MTYQLIYSSDFTPGARGALSEFRSILHASRANNYRAGITGCLLFDRDAFVQILEGEREAVQGLFDRLSSDDRHDRLKLVCAGHVETPGFAVWSMVGFVRDSQNEHLFKQHHFARQKRRHAFVAARILNLAADLVKLQTLKSLPPVIDRYAKPARAPVADLVVETTERLAHSHAQL